MPIENERKLVLHLNTPEKAFSEIAEAVEHIEQSYLINNKNQSVRIRKIFVFTPGKYCEIKYNFTFKQDVGKKTVEIETDLDLDDYNLLNRQAIIKLNKYRYKFNGWEVDFFKNIDKTYFVQAEIELPVNQKKPEEIPLLVQENLIYKVKRGDGRFSSKKLGNVRYAQRLLEGLSEIVVK